MNWPEQNCAYQKNLTSGRLRSLDSSLKYASVKAILSQGGAKMKYQWLKDYKELEEHLIYLKWNLNKSKLELIRWVEGDLQGIKLAKESRAAKLEEQIAFIENEINETTTKMEEAIDIIDSFEDLNSTIVQLKYIEGMRLEDIAEEIGYSASYVRQRHAEIAKMLDFLESYERRSTERRAMQVETEHSNDELLAKDFH